MFWKYEVEIWTKKQFAMKLLDTGAEGGHRSPTEAGSLSDRCVVSTYLPALVKHVVILVDVERGDGGRGVGVHPDGEIKAVRPEQSRRRGQSLQRHDRVLRGENQNEGQP